MKNLYISSDLYNMITEVDILNAFKNGGKGNFKVMQFPNSAEKHKYIVSNMEDYCFCKSQERYMEKIHVTFVGYDVFISVRKSLKELERNRIEVDVVDATCNVEDIIRYEIYAGDYKKGNYVRSIAIDEDDKYPELLLAWLYILKNEDVSEKEMYSIIEENEWDFESMLLNIIMKFNLEHIVKNNDNSSEFSKIIGECDGALEKIKIGDFYRNIYRLVFSGKVYGNGDKTKYSLNEYYIPALVYILSKIKEKSENRIMNRKNGWVKEIVPNEIVKRLLGFTKNEINGSLKGTFDCLTEVLERKVGQEDFYEISEEIYEKCKKILCDINYDGFKNEGLVAEKRKTGRISCSFEERFAKYIYDEFRRNYIKDRWGKSGENVYIKYESGKFVDVLTEEESL